MVSSCPRHSPANRVLRRLLPVLSVVLLFLLSGPASAQRVFAAGGTLEQEHDGENGKSCSAAGVNLYTPGLCVSPWPRGRPSAP